MRSFIIKYSDVARCPKKSILPGHYRPDGTCRCDEREELKKAVAETSARLKDLREWLRTS